MTDAYDCTEIATLEMFQVVGDPPALLPVGIFCVDHYIRESAIRRAAGERTAVSVAKGPPQLCCWVPSEAATPPRG